MSEIEMRHFIEVKGTGSVHDAEGNLLSGTDVSFGKQEVTAEWLEAHGLPVPPVDSTITQEM